MYIFYKTMHKGEKVKKKVVKESKKKQNKT